MTFTNLLLHQFSSLTDEQINQFADLLLNSGPELFRLLFGNDHAHKFLRNACSNSDGQFGYKNHYFCIDKETAQLTESKIRLFGCFTLWSHKPTNEFIEQTLSALKTKLTEQQLKHCILLNRHLEKTFLPPKPNELCLGHVCVAPKYRRLGVAGFVLEHATQLARFKHKKRLVLDVESTNHAAISCYKRAGFHSQTQNYFMPLDKTYVRMIKSL